MHLKGSIFLVLLHYFTTFALNPVHTPQPVWPGLTIFTTSLPQPLWPDLSLACWPPHFHYFATSPIHCSILLNQSGLVSPFSLHYYLPNTLPFSLLHYLTHTLFSTPQPVWPGLSIFTTSLPHPYNVQYSSASLAQSLHFHYITTSLILCHFHYFTTSPIHCSIILSQSGLVSPFLLLHYLTHTMFNTPRPVWPGLSIFTTLLPH